MMMAARSMNVTVFQLFGARFPNFFNSHFELQGHIGKGMVGVYDDIVPVN